MGLVLAAAAPCAIAGDYEEALGYHQGRNYAQSLPLFLRAAEQGDARAQHALAYIYGSGQGLPSDLVEAYKWVLLAQTRGDTEIAGLRLIYERQMSAEQIAQAQERARQMVAKPPRARVLLRGATPGAAAGAENGVLEALEAWRAAWAARDADGYLAAYAPDFKLPATYPRARWEAQRRERVARPSLNIVRIANPVVSVAADGSASARFIQTFQSNSYRETVEKMLVFGNYNGKWLIREETGARVKNTER
jgi:hypothetical protein